MLQNTTFHQCMVQTNLDRMQHRVIGDHFIEKNWLQIHRCKLLRWDYWACFAFTLQTNAFVVGYDDVLVLICGKVYKIKNAGLMVEGAVYNVSIKQYHNAHVLIMKLGTLAKWWVPCKHLYQVYNNVLNTIEYYTHQSTLNQNEVVNMLKNMTSRMGFFQCG